MGRSSLLGIERAEREPPGRDAAALGPSDSSDIGSDVVGVEDAPSLDPGLPVDVALREDARHRLADADGLASTTDASGTGERRSAGSDGGAPDGRDISIDRFVGGPPVDTGDGREGDFDFLDDAQAPGPLEDEDDQDAVADAVADAEDADAGAVAGRRQAAGNASRPKPAIPHRHNPAPDRPDPPPGEPADPGDAEGPAPEDDEDAEDHRPGRSSNRQRGVA
jgi:hypothetical protein